MILLLFNSSVGGGGIIMLPIKFMMIVCIDRTAYDTFP